MRIVFNSQFFKIYSQVLTGRYPYPEAPREGQICVAMIQKQQPCDVNLLLPNKFEEADYDTVLALESLYSTLPRCWDLDPQRRPSINSLMSQITNPSLGRVTTVSRTGKVSSDGSREGESPPQNSSRKPVDPLRGTQGAELVDVPPEPASKNVSKRKRGTLCPSEDLEDNKDDRRVRARVEEGADGGMQDEDDEEREVSFCGSD